MPGSFSNYAESGVLGHLFLTASLTKPAALGIALCSNVPADTDLGTLAVGHEVANAGAYARQADNPADANWAFSYTNGSGTITNVGTITFPAATADWGWVSGVAICDSTTWNGGNFIIGGSLALPKLVSNGDQFKFNAGDIKLYLD